MSALIAFVDTETTSLRHDRRAWEIGIIARRPGEPDAEHHWFVDACDLDLGNADPFSLKIGRFHERHPEYRAGQVDGFRECNPEDRVMAAVEAVTRGAHLVGAVVSFDAEVLAARMRAHGICPSWHYHLTDVEALAVGWLNFCAADLENREESPEEAARLRAIARPPWDSDELSRAVGVDPGQFSRHEALGDAKWARALHDAVTGYKP